MATKLIKCSCGSEVLSVNHDKELNLVEFAIFNDYTQNGNKLSFGQRLRWAFNAIMGKKPYSDQIIFDTTKGEFSDLAAFLFFCQNKSR